MTWSGCPVTAWMLAAAACVARIIGLKQRWPLVDCRTWTATMSWSLVTATCALL